jgi:hypothetical protein
MKKGDKIICMPGIDYRIPVICEGYYLEKQNNSEERFYIAINAEKIKTFNQSNIDEIFDGEVFLIDDPSYIVPYSQKKFDKFFIRCTFLYKVSFIYYLFYKWYEFNYKYEDIFNTRFYRKLVNKFKFVRFRFFLEIIKLATIGLLKRLYYFFCFFVDIIKHLFDAYFEYKESINQLNYKRVESKSLVMRVSLSAEQIQEGIKEKEEKLKSAKERYFNINITFMTLVISLVAILLTVVFNKIENSNTNKKIEGLETQNAFLQSIINEKELEIEKLQEKNVELKSKEIEDKLLKTDLEISTHLQNITQAIETILSEKSK